MLKEDNCQPEFYTSKNKGHIFRQKKKSEKIYLQEIHMKSTFSWQKKNNLRDRKMQAEMKTKEKTNKRVSINEYLLFETVLMLHEV